MNPKLKHQDKTAEIPSAEAPPFDPREYVRRRPTLHVCGLNHVRAAIELRERYALSPERCADLAREIAAWDKAAPVQVMVLSTCNRTELYAFSSRPRFAAELRQRFLAVGEGSDPAAGPPPIYEYQAVEAVRHLFAVGAGLDSMILGENQIKQQIVSAFEISHQAGASGPDLHKLVEACFHAGKRIRTETDLNVGTMCVAKAAVLRGEQTLGSLRGKVCMVIGAGKVGRIAARAIMERHPGRLWIVNRTVERAGEIAGELGAEAYGLESLGCLLPEADFVLGAAFAPELIIDEARYREICEGKRAPERVCMVDAAVPRILDPDLARLPAVRLWDIEHMEEIVEENRRKRVSAAQTAWAIVEEEVEKFRVGLQMQELAPMIQRLRGQFEEIFDQEQSQLESNVTHQMGNRMRATHHRIKQRLMHEVIQQMKNLMEVDG
jgi:glutamyl-tRNA reductase